MAVLKHPMMTAAASHVDKVRHPRAGASIRSFRRWPLGPRAYPERLCDELLQPGLGQSTYLVAKDCALRRNKEGHRESEDTVELRDVAIRIEAEWIVDARRFRKRQRSLSAVFRINADKSDRTV